MEHRDRVETEVILDADVKSVLEFMQSNISAGKLVGVSNAVPQLAKLLWGHYQQEPCSVVTLSPPLPSTSCETPQVSTE